MTDYEYKIQRVGFLQGMIKGITLCARWRYGEQLVGVKKRALIDVLKPYQEKLAQLTKDVKNLDTP